MTEPAMAALWNVPADQLRRLWRQGQRPDVSQYLACAGHLSLAQVVAVLRADQEARWQAAEGVPAETYLATHPALAHDPEIALELVYGEFLLREGLGQTPTLDEYLRRFPQYASRLKQQVQLHEALADDPWSDLPASRPDPEEVSQ